MEESDADFFVALGVSDNTIELSSMIPSVEEVVFQDEIESRCNEAIRVAARSLLSTVVQSPNSIAPAEIEDIHLDIGVTAENDKIPTNVKLMRNNFLPDDEIVDDECSSDSDDSDIGENDDAMDLLFGLDGSKKADSEDSDDDLNDMLANLSVNSGVVAHKALRSTRLGGRFSKEEMDLETTRRVMQNFTIGETGQVVPGDSDDEGAPEIEYLTAEEIAEMTSDDRIEYLKETVEPPESF